jgi:hypothetical protein
MDVTSVSEQLLFTTVRIEACTHADSHNTGTGFIFRYTAPQGIIDFIITNKHVIKDAREGRFIISQAKDGKPNLGVGHTLTVTDFEKIWYGHSSSEIDVAIAPLVPLLAQAQESGMQLFYKSVPSSLVVSEDTLQFLDALEEVIFIGYPNGIWDKKNLLPIMRKGITATPVSIDFQGKKQFLIDASVFPGSSGSPVFLLNTGMYFDRKTNSTVVGNRLLFLGIVASVYCRQDQNEIILVPAPTVNIPVAISKQMINLGVVFKASVIIETIEDFMRDKGIFGI